MSYFDFVDADTQAWGVPTDGIRVSVADSCLEAAFEPVGKEATLGNSALHELDDDFFLYLGRPGCEHDSLSVPGMSSLMFIEDELVYPTVFVSNNRTNRI